MPRILRPHSSGRTQVRRACFVTLVCLLFIGQGCRGQPSGSSAKSIPPQASTAPSITPQNTLSPTPVVASTNTPPPVPEQQAPEQPDSDPLATDPPSPELTVTLAETSPQALDPLSFSFPTMGPNPVSNWRPPLYPIPWEPSPFDHFFFSRPIGADQVNWPLARYRYGALLYAEPHTGIDIPAPKGTPVLAAGPGKVIWSGYGLYLPNDIYRDPYGNAIAIKHDFGYKGEALYTVYGHLDENYVWRGQHVEAGEVIGKVGETGKVSGPHLHFEVRLGDNKIVRTQNPELWLSPPQGWGILVGRVLDSNGDLMLQAGIKVYNEDTRQVYDVTTYAEGAVNSDSYYRENVVLGDLQAGNYSVWINNENTAVKAYMKVLPGMVTYFKFTGTRGYDLSFPPTPAGPEAFPPIAISTPIP